VHPHARKGLPVNAPIRAGLQRKPPRPARIGIDFDAKPIVESNSYGYVKAVANVRMRRDA
jgi:hypothetical protein